VFHLHEEILAVAVRVSLTSRLELEQVYLAHDDLFFFFFFFFFFFLALSLYIYISFISRARTLLLSAAAKK